MSVCSRTSVERWLSQVQSPDYGAISKRKHNANIITTDFNDDDAIDRDSRPVKRRRALQLLHPNVVACMANEDRHITRSTSSSPTKQGAGVPNRAPLRTPNRATTQRTIPLSRPAHSTHGDDEHADDDDDDAAVWADATPRAPSLHFSQRSASQSGTSSSSRNTTRSRSPTKKMVAFAQVGGGGVTYEALLVDAGIEAKRGHRHGHILVDMWEPYLEPLADFAAGRGVVPADKMAELQGHHERKVQREFRWQDCFDTSGQRQRLGAHPELEHILDIVEKSIVCEDDQEHEAAWNCSVHWPILDLALKTSVFADVLQLKHISIAQISPRSLAPQPASGPLHASRMVDMSFVAKPTTVMAEGFKNLSPLPGAMLASYNHTTHGPVIKKPIVLSIETKSSTVAQESGLPQLTTWVMAHFTRLRLLHGAASGNTSPFQPPLLFLISACGPQWAFYAATQTPNNEGGTILWHFPNTVTSRTCTGVYGIIACLHKLFQWAAESYIPWFEREAVPLSE